MIKTPDTFWDGLTPQDFATTDANGNQTYNFALSLNALNTWFSVTPLPVPKDASTQNKARYEKQKWSSQRKFDAEAAQVELKKNLDLQKAQAAQQRNTKAFQSRKAKLLEFEGECDTAKNTEATALTA